MTSRAERAEALLADAREALEVTTRILSQCLFQTMCVKGQWLDREEVVASARATLARIGQTPRTWGASTFGKETRMSEAELSGGQKPGANRGARLSALQNIVEEVERTNRTHTRNAGTDFRARCFIDDHGQALLDEVLRLQEAREALSMIAAMGRSDDPDVARNIARMAVEQAAEAVKRIDAFAPLPPAPAQDDAK